MSLKIFLAVLLGTGVGYFFLPATISSSIGIIIDIGLMVLLFFVGMDIGKQKDVFQKIKKMGLRILLVPAAIIAGSIIGSMLAGLLLKMPINEAGAVGAGLGWYTLSSTMLLADGYIELSALAFLSNVFREIMALILIPIIAKYVGKIESLSTAGATAMDTSLPVISASTDPETAIIAFITGVICTTAVPIILPIILKL
ncbi:lysine exporter LysO family protein [Tissierella carlieri]|uniref:Lysine exporter LysO family protein n=1 Tax=Tissierella carlieri TaxID=689904 RepID=A0ABT1S4V8_9FIRM|nr:lysine exporter LysO family protein [Tissierella carlieri]MBU5310954.1 lysine exporter LysO family protein [Tissierella carlieri]MCQ4921499.1 lysine exporter LysO family protein [Tissierella carlieri]